MRDCNFLKPRRLAPDALAGDQARRAARPASSARNSAGMKAGSFCPSPSSVDDERRARRRHPVRTAADCPQDCLCRTLAQPGTLRHQPLQLGLGAVGRAVVDIDDLERPLARRARRRSRRPVARHCRPRCAPARRRKPPDRCVVHDRGPVGRPAMPRFLFSQQRAGNRFDAACSDGPGYWHARPVRAERRSQAAAAANQRRTRARRRSPTSAPASTSLG